MDNTHVSLDLCPENDVSASTGCWP